mgnify:CR=1 FL=1
MDSATIKTVAAELLGLTLTDAEAQALVEPLAAQRKTIGIVEKVPLPYSARPFVTPRASEDWLENWQQK